MSRLLTPALRRILGAASISNLGDGIYFVALPLLGATITKDPTSIAGIAAVGMVPSLLLALPAGGFVDRVDRGRLMVIVDIARAALVALLVVAVAYDQVALWHLYVVAFGLGIGELLFDTASEAFLPAVVDEEHLPRANGFLSTAAELGNGIVGPALGGLLFAAAASLPFLLNSLSFFFASLLIYPIAWRLRGSKAPAAASAEPEDRGRFWQEIREGIVWLYRHKTLRALALVLAGWNVFGWLPEATLVLYVEQELGVGPAGFGLLFGASSVGAVLGGVLSGRLIDTLGMGRVMQLTIASYAVLMAPPFFVSSALIVGLAFFGQGVLLVAWGVVSVTYRQTNVPNHMLGRIGSVFFLLAVGLAPIGLMLGGLIADWFGLRSVFLVSAIGLGVLYLLSARSLAELGRHAEEQKAMAARDAEPS